MNYQVKDSYLITDVEEIEYIVTRLYLDELLGQSRTIHSYVKEWYAHNLMYKLGLFRSHTKDCDLNSDEPLYRRVIYSIIWFFRKR